MAGSGTTFEIVPDHAMTRPYTKVQKALRKQDPRPVWLLETCPLDNVWVKIGNEAYVVNGQLHGLTSTRPYVTYEKDGQIQRIDCDYIAGCDGYHGVRRQSIPAYVLRTYEKGYPFGWLGIMSETPPFLDLCYCYHTRGFALASMRSPMLSRYYIQCDLDTRLEDWPDERFLAGIQGAMSKGDGRPDCHRPVDRKINCTFAQLRR